jgi:hypothetical protein
LRVGVVALGAFAILPAAATTSSILLQPTPASAHRNREVGRWFDRELQAGETLYVMCASASVYAYADADPPLPYLWLDGVNQVPGAKELLADLLTDPRRAPTFVARFQDEAACGLEHGLVDELYTPFTTVEGVPIWIRKD